MDDPRNSPRHWPVFSMATRLTRQDIFGPSDDQIPVSEPEDAHIPQVGFVGSAYQTGGDILLGINPGGGGDHQVRTPQDADLLPRIAALRGQPSSSDPLRDMFDLYAANMRTWNLWRIVEPVLGACARCQDDIAYLNWCPFRTRQDKMPGAQAMSRCTAIYLPPLIEALAPARVIALGKKAGGWLEKLSWPGVETFVIPRTIGDSYLSDEARIALERLKKSTSERIFP